MDDSQASWDDNAQAWETFMGDGNSFHRLLVVDSQLRLIGTSRNKLSVELACGNGNFLPHLVECSDLVVGIDSSSKMLAFAEERLAKLSRCRLIEADLTTVEYSALVDPGTANLVVCTMALMDIRSLRHLAAGVAMMLCPGGRFVATIAHPAFWGPSPRAERAIHYSNDEGVLRPRPSVVIRSYKTDQELLGRADASLPVPQTYFARSLESIFQPFLESNLVIDSLLEPTFPTDEKLKRLVRPDEWRSYPDIPPVLAFRMILKD